MSQSIVGFLHLLAIAFYFGGAGVLFYVVHKFSSRATLKQKSYPQFLSTGLLLMAGGFLCETMVKSDVNARLEVGLLALLNLVLAVCIPWSGLKLPGGRNGSQITSGPSLNIESGSLRRSGPDPKALG
jgi:hypothetical protein